MPSSEVEEPQTSEFQLQTQQVQVKVEWHHYDSLTVQDNPENTADDVSDGLHDGVTSGASSCQTAKAKFTCQHCSKTYGRRSRLKVHVEKVHKDQLSFICETCGKQCVDQRRLTMHIQMVHQQKKNDPVEIKCAHCTKVYTSTRCLQRHVQTVHEVPKKRYSSLMRCKCIVPGCELHFHKRVSMIRHLVSDHGREIHVENLSFTDWQEFDLWRVKEMKKNSVTFTKQSGSKKSGSTSRYYFVCQQDGSGMAHRRAGQASPQTTTELTSIREQLKPGKACPSRKDPPVKTGKACPSRVIVQVKSDLSVHVTYYRDHDHEISNEGLEDVPKVHSQGDVLQASQKEHLSVKTEDSLPDCPDNMWVMHTTAEPARLTASELIQGRMAQVRRWLDEVRLSLDDGRVHEHFDTVEALVRSMVTSVRSLYDGPASRFDSIPGYGVGRQAMMTDGETSSVIPDC